jgi:hypothetical protein
VRPLPEATTENVVEEPTTTVALTGCVLMVGVDPVLLPVVPEEPEPPHPIRVPTPARHESVTT